MRLRYLFRSPSPTVTPRASLCTNLHITSRVPLSPRAGSLILHVPTSHRKLRPPSPSIHSSSQLTSASRTTSNAHSHAAPTGSVLESCPRYDCW
ncbi:hypothetical protein JB92DRAFT_3060646 [Gautieria morchelliformis]|nr:hypothetical protein JB92DRAFT_3060646 [Gautieria morchelliformis]